MATATQDLLNVFSVTFGFEVVYQPARGTTPLNQNPKEWVRIIIFIYPVILEYRLG